METSDSFSKIVRCPHCRKKVGWDENPHRPFCSERCRQIDLVHWAAESYRIPVKEGEPTEFAREEEQKNHINKDIEE